MQFRHVPRIQRPKHLVLLFHDIFIKRKHFPRYWPFVRGIHRSPCSEFPSQNPVTRSFDIFFDLSQIKRLSKHSRRWWFEMPSCPLWRHCKVDSLRCSETIISSPWFRYSFGIFESLVKLNLSSFRTTWHTKHIYMIIIEQSQKCSFTQISFHFIAFCRW